MKEFCSAVILAGGKSIRMGFDKQLIKIDKERLITHIIEKLNNEFEDIVIVTNVAEYYTKFSCKIVSDEIKGRGPLSGIHIGLKKAVSEYVYFLACDMPNVNLDYIRFMKNRIKNKNVDACITRIGKWVEPFNAFYSKRIIKEIENNLLKKNEDRQRSIFSLIENLNCFYIKEEEARKFSPNWDMFLNLNTKEELKKYISILKE